MDKEVVLEIHRDDLMWFALGSCISADSNGTNEERMENIKTMEELLSTFKEPDVIEQLSEETIRNYTSYCEKGIELLKKEIEQNQ
jgi:hypothetical protein